MPVKRRRYRLTPLAVSDLENIWLYTFEQWSREQADRYYRDLLEAIEALARGARTGRLVDIREGYLKYAVGQHFVFYRLSTTTLDVVRILHRRMDVDRHL